MALLRSATFTVAQAINMTLLRSKAFRFSLTSEWRYLNCPRAQKRLFHEALKLSISLTLKLAILGEDDDKLKHIEHQGLLTLRGRALAVAVPSPSRFSLSS